MVPTVAIPEEDAKRLSAGRLLASPSPGEEVCITGLASRFPESDDIYQYRYNLLNKVDMITCDNRRWEPTHPEIPQRTGKINYLNKLDAGYFGMHYRLAEMMDPMCRIMLERAVEAVMDAGYNPEELRGTSTGVFVGACVSESEKTCFYDELIPPTYAILANNCSMIAQRVSYALGLNGHSKIVDTACSSSLYAFHQAYQAIRMGHCEMALVGGVSLCLQPIVSLQFARLGVLSMDGSCKSFDNDADGYARSETVSAILLQKTKDARRVYAQVVHTKSNCDGYKEQGITFPSGAMQKQLLEETYQESNVDPTTVDFVEAHATGTKVGDPEEIIAMDEVFCANRKTPLYVGSIKSNLGHSEAASGMCSIAKILLSMENNCLLPNINYSRPREGAEALEKGRMVVVTDVTPWPVDGSGLAAINSFGFGGANIHVVLKRHTKRKNSGGLPRDDLPRLVCFSGRTKEAVAYICDDVSGRTLDAEFVRLLQEIFKKNIQEHPYRGHILMAKYGEVSRSVEWFDQETKPACLVLGAPSEQWMNFGKDLFVVPLFAAAVQRAHNILSLEGINVTEILSTDVSKQDPLDIIVGSVVTQIGVVDVLKALNFSPDYIIGHSVGELVAAYTDGALSLEETILATIAAAKCFKNLSANIKSYEIYTRTRVNIPEELESMNINSNSAYVVSGPIQKLTLYVNKLLSTGATVKEVQNWFGPCGKNLTSTKPHLLKYLKEIIKEPRKMSSKWITTTPNVASAEYFTGAFLNSMFLPSLASAVPNKTTFIEIGTTFYTRHNIKTIPLLPVDGPNQNGVHALLNGLASMYTCGYNINPENLYPRIQWPVSINTPMVSPLVKWNYSEDWHVSSYKRKTFMKEGERRVTFKIKDSEGSFMLGHVIDGRNLLPATGYLFIVWETYAMMMDMLLTDMKIVFENVKFHRATNISKSGSVYLNVMIHKLSGSFEVGEIGQPIVTGEVYIPKDFPKETVELQKPIGAHGLPMLTKDMYKELKLRGYNYMEEFRAITQSDLGAKVGLVTWTGNWITFMDALLQMKILQEDTRHIYIPTGIQRLAVDAKAHIRYVQEKGENAAIPAYVYDAANVIKAGAIEIRGLMPSSISRRKPLGEPVLEVHKFIPNEAEITVEESVRTFTQIFLENSYGIKVRAVEYIEEPKMDVLPLSPLVLQAFKDQPLIQPEVVVLTKEAMEIPNITIENKRLSTETSSCSIVIVSNIFDREETQKHAVGALKENGIIVSREDADIIWEEASVPEFTVIGFHKTGKEVLVMLRRSEPVKAATVVDMSESTNNFDWLPPLQVAMKKDEKVILFAQRNPLSGIMGFYNCIRREPGGLNVSCVFVMDKEAPEFDAEDKFYADQLKKGLAVNVFKDGKWGTYRHLQLSKEERVEREHVYCNVTVRGDLSSLKWIEGPLTSKSALETEHSLIQVYYSSLNFRDIMTASGRISNDFITRDRLKQENVQGFEFVGRDQNGKRVMGMVTSGALTSMVDGNSYLISNISESFTMEEAATIPVAYGTALYAFEVGDIKAGDSILIHAGSGAVGQAAINIALFYKCNIFTTVGTREKRDFIRTAFPKIPESHIGNSRDTSFEQMVMKETNGRGVDAVLNSLSEEKLQASVRCLAFGGSFLEIGKFDLIKDNAIKMRNLGHNRSFHSVMLDAFFLETAKNQKMINKLITNGVIDGSIKPLNRKIFEQDDIEQAFRYMAAGKHIGKVVIKLRDEEPKRVVKPEFKLFKGIPRFYANPKTSYILVGGLGGFGLELADWLIMRGVKNLVFVSRTGIKTGYQASRIRLWRTYGTAVSICTANVATREGCKLMIEKAKLMGPVEGIFNLAVVLKDALLENQNEESYKISLAPKAIATQFLDELSRELCPELKCFVVFSSVSCGRGNIGQTNYGMSNSVMERICELRRQKGLPATAIQWGAIGEVGLVAEMQELQTEIEIAGSLQQRVCSCLEVMDKFLAQEEAVVSSMVVAEKQSGAGNADNIVDAVKNIMGLKDLKTVSIHSTLSELGMDSMMAVEIKQTLEREYEVFLTAHEIRSMTFARLQDISQEKILQSDSHNEKENKELMPQGMYLLLRTIGDENMALVPMVRVQSLIKEKSVARKIFLLPGIEGMATVMEPLAINLASHCFCLQYMYTVEPEATIEDLAKSLLPLVQDNLPASTPFTLVCYSYGAIVGVELAALLEAEGRMGRVILIDGAPAMLKELLKQQVSEIESEPLLQTVIVSVLLQLVVAPDKVMTWKNDLYNCKTFDDRVAFGLTMIESENVPHSVDYIKRVCKASYLRVRSVLHYQPKFRKLKSMVKLFKASKPTIESFDGDYKLQQLCENAVEVNVVEGNHLTILRNTQVAYSINNIIDTSNVFFKQPLINKPEVEALKEVIIKQV